VELPSVDELVNQAVTVLIESMGQEVWTVARSAFAKFFGKGRSTPAVEGAKLDKHRDRWQSASGDERFAIEQDLAEVWRDRLTEVATWRPEAVAELQQLLRSLAPRVEHAQVQITATASDTSVVQVSGRDLTIGDQPITLKSAGRRNNSKDPQ
jgi:hypothetical protein